jgi:hypothetical protein
VLVGITTMKLLSMSDTAWDAWEDKVGTALPRPAVRALLGATLAVHVAEAAVAHRRASAAGLDAPGRWARTTLLYGFPVLGRLSRATADATG